MSLHIKNSKQKISTFLSLEKNVKQGQKNKTHAKQNHVSKRNKDPKSQPCSTPQKKEKILNKSSIKNWVIEKKAK